MWNLNCGIDCRKPLVGKWLGWGPSEINGNPVEMIRGLFMLLNGLHDDLCGLFILYSTLLDYVVFQCFLILPPILPRLPSSSPSAGLSTVAINDVYCTKSYFNYNWLNRIEPLSAPFMLRYRPTSSDRLFYCSHFRCGLMKISAVFNW